MTTQSGGGGRQPLAASLGNIQQRAPAAPLGSGPSSPMIVHIADSFYNGMAAGLVDYFAWDFCIAYDFFAGNINASLADVNVSAGQVLDLSQVRFYLVGPDGALAGVLYRDEWLKINAVAANTSFRILVNGRAPMDITATSNIGVPPSTFAGYSWLNRNLFDMWGSVPVHLIVPPGQRLEIRVTLPAGLPIMGGFPPYIGVELYGRWLAKSVWDKLVERG